MEQVHERLTALERVIHVLVGHVEDLLIGIGKINERLDCIESRLDRLEVRIDNLGSKVDNLEIRMDKVEIALGDLRSFTIAGFKAVESRLDKVEKELSDLTRYTIAGFGVLDVRLDQIQFNFDNLGTKLDFVLDEITKINGVTLYEEINKNLKTIKP